jgi:serine protease Do
VLVSDVAVDSPAARAGLQRGDIILEVGDTKVNSPAEFQKSVQNLVKDKAVLLLVKRNQNTIFLPLKPE